MSEQTPERTGFVIGDDGAVAVQVADPASRWGFYVASLATDNEDERADTYDGGFGWTARSWVLVTDDDPRLTAFDHQRYDWLLEETRAGLPPQ